MIVQSYFTRHEIPAAYFTDIKSFIMLTVFLIGQEQVEQGFIGQRRITNCRGYIRLKTIVSVILLCTVRLEVFENNYLSD